MWSITLLLFFIFIKSQLFTSYINASSDSEGAGARSRLDDVLKGLVERSESEKSVNINMLNSSHHCHYFTIRLMSLCLNREQNEGDTEKISADSLNKYESKIFVKCTV